MEAELLYTFRYTRLLYADVHDTAYTPLSVRNEEGISTFGVFHLPATATSFPFTLLLFLSRSVSSVDVPPSLLFEEVSCVQLRKTFDELSNLLSFTSQPDRNPTGGGGQLTSQRRT